MAEDRKFKFENGQFVNRVSGEAIPDDEPVIIFRARDWHALQVLEYYHSLVTDDHHDQAVQDRIAEFRAFKDNFPTRMKEPGITRHITLNTPATEASGEVVQADYTGIDAENAAWAWLEQKYGSPSDDPVDRVYDANEMVNAFHAGRFHRLTHSGVGNVVASEEITEAMWGGLARSIMMWLDMEPKTPRALFKHLERSGVPIPQWLRDEPEMQGLDHVPSKGTRCVLIYKAMRSALSTTEPVELQIDREKGA